MSKSIIRKVLFLGTLAIVGIIVVQSYWLYKSWDLKDQEFNFSINIVLRRVALGISKYNNTPLPKKNLIQRRSSNIYAVNVNGQIDAGILEDLLYQELIRVSIYTDFEYAVYNCESDDLVYGNYCHFAEKTTHKNQNKLLPKFDKLTYYFVVHFPNRQGYIANNLINNLILAFLAVLTVLFFSFSMIVILRQKKQSELQKDFINNMTHEFKTPLASIKIASEYIKNNNTILNDQKLAKYANIIYDQNERLSSQVERVLNIAKLENDSLRLEITKLDLKELVESIVNDENLRLQKQLIKIECENGQFLINADELHLTNLIYNILDNALKYSDNNKDVTVSITNRGNNILLAIQDRGIGIPQEDLKKIFEKFYRVDTGDRHDVKGFGLGLYYVKIVCNNHGWTINVESKPNFGTKISIIIPDQK